MYVLYRVLEWPKPLLIFAELKDLKTRLLSKERKRQRTKILTILILIRKLRMRGLEKRPIKHAIVTNLASLQKLLKTML